MWQQADWLDEEEVEVLASFLDVHKKLQGRKLGRESEWKASQLHKGGLGTHPLF